MDIEEFYSRNLFVIYETHTAVKTVATTVVNFSPLPKYIIDLGGGKTHRKFLAIFPVNSVKAFFTRVSNSGKIYNKELQITQNTEIDFIGNTRTLGNDEVITLLKSLDAIGKLPL